MKLLTFHRFPGFFYFLGVCFTALLSADNLPSFGIEMEFALRHRLETNPKNLPDEVYRTPLQIVAKLLGDPNGAIDIRLWPRYSFINAKYALYRDRKFKVWKITPERVNFPFDYNHKSSAPGLDGVELISPILEDSDLALLPKIQQDILDHPDYEMGMNSSMHVTVGLKGQIGRNGNLDRVVNLNTYLENNWPNIYAAIGPTRQGTLVNRYAIPFGWEHPDTVDELANLPRIERDRQRVHWIYLKPYVESLKRKYFVSDAFKYRAHSVQKLFGIQTPYLADVVEFRIADLVPAERVIPTIQLFRTIVAKGPDIEPRAPFRHPFRGCYRRGDSLAELDDRILETSKEEYQDFLEKLGFTLEDYPMHPGIGTTTPSPPIEMPTRDLVSAFATFVKKYFQRSLYPREIELLKVFERIPDWENVSEFLTLDPPKHLPFLKRKRLQATGFDFMLYVYELLQKDLSLQEMELEFSLLLLNWNERTPLPSSKSMSSLQRRCVLMLEDLS